MNIVILSLLELTVKMYLSYDICAQLCQAFSLLNESVKDFLPTIQTCQVTRKLSSEQNRSKWTKE